MIHNLLKQIRLHYFNLFNCFTFLSLTKRHRGHGIVNTQYTKGTYHS